MKSKPKRLVWLTLFMCAIALIFPAQVMLMYGHTPFEPLAVAAKLSPLNWVIMWLAALSALFAFQASPWMMTTLPTLTAAMLYNNWYVGQMATDYPSWVTVLASGGFVLAVGAMLGRDAVSVVLNPQTRWWLTPQRKRLVIPVRLKLLNLRAPAQGAYGNDEFYVRTYDVSEGGAFISLDQSGGVAESRDRLEIFGSIFKDLAVGTQCYVSLPLTDVSYIQCRAEIVRSTLGRGNYPAGFGLRFLGLSWSERRRLAQFLG